MINVTGGDAVSGTAEAAKPNGMALSWATTPLGGGGHANYGAVSKNWTPCPSCVALGDSRYPLGMDPCACCVGLSREELSAKDFDAEL